MNPEALTGMELGKSVLQRVLGQGTMGAVYLASQADRQVAVKVFLPASSLEQADHEEFLQRLEQIIASDALLNHPYILPILSHGRQENLVYQIMPYIAGENLESRIARAGALPFVQIQHYLEQVAAALDHAHASGILHCDVKTSNILLTPEGDALISDFGLARLTTEKNFASTRRAVPGMLNAIAPEYVLGKAPDHHTDLYSLGAVLYQMVTGAALFQGATLGEVAMKHIKAAPASPRSLRADLPQAAEQVMLRALAKRPEDRYSHARDLASAFRLALAAAQPAPAGDEEANALNALAELASSGQTTAVRLPTARTGGLFDPKWQTRTPSSAAATRELQESASAEDASPLPFATLSDLVSSYGEQPPASVSSQVQADSENIAEQDTAGMQALPPAQEAASADEPPAFAAQPDSPKRTGLLGFANFQASLDQPFAQNRGQADSELQVANMPAGNTEELNKFAPQANASPTGMLGALATIPHSGSGDATGTIKLTEPVKIVQMPVAGQPGHFMTGFLPVVPPEQAPEVSGKRVSKRVKIASLLLIVLVILAGSGTFLVIRSRTKPAASTQMARVTPNLSATADAQVTATANANIILADPLNQNIHQWPQGSQGWYTCTFEGGAYHIADHDKVKNASVLLPSKPINSPFAYTLTMEQVKGDTTNPNNQLGMILDASVQNTQGKQVVKFYSFEILNRAGGQYQFWKYDSSKDSANPWKKLWSHSFGKEFKQGSGPSHINTVKIVATGKMFTFIVNGKQMGTWKDSSFTSGNVGMLVNLNGAEVAFSNLLLTYS